MSVPSDFSLWCVIANNLLWFAGVMTTLYLNEKDKNNSKK